MQSLQELVFAETVKDALAKYVDGITSVLSSFRGDFEHLKRYSGQHVLNATIWQRVPGQKLRKLWLQQTLPI